MEAINETGQQQKSNAQGGLPEWLSLVFSILLLLGGGIFLFLGSGGFPPAPWKLLMYAQQHQAEIQRQHGDILTVPMATLVLHLFFLAVAWLSLFISLYVSVTSLLAPVFRRSTTKEPTRRREPVYEAPATPLPAPVETFIPFTPEREQSQDTLLEQLEQIFEEEPTTKLPEPEPELKKQTLLIGARTETGHDKRYTLNEDRLFMQQWSPTFYQLPEVHGLFMIAECTGPLASGQVANKQIIQTVSDVFIPAFMTDPGDVERLTYLLGQGMQDAIFTHQLNNEMLTHVAASALFVLDQEAYAVLLGESRLYAYTKQHGHAQVYTPTDGMNIVSLPVQGETTYLLCSDGLWNLVSQEQITAILHNYGHTPAQAADKLIVLALQSGGHDNVSVIIVHVADKQEQEETDDELDALFADPELRDIFGNR